MGGDARIGCQGCHRAAAGHNFANFDVNLPIKPFRLKRHAGTTEHLYVDARPTTEALAEMQLHWNAALLSFSAGCCGRLLRFLLFG